jgi:hypothetical protein
MPKSLFAMRPGTARSRGNHSESETQNNCDTFKHGTMKKTDAAGPHPLRFSQIGCQSGPLHQISFAIATAVSAMRLEKPHSLSYQDRIETRVPSMTLVWSVWKIDECGSWLKSIDTFLSSV